MLLLRCGPRARRGLFGVMQDTYAGLPWRLSGKNPPATQETYGKIPGEGNHSRIRAWRIP